MSLRKFGKNDVILNTMKAYPSCRFVIFDGKIYYNNVPEQSGNFSPEVLNVPAGNISLYEYNIDKLEGANEFIYPFITKDSAGASFSTVGQVSYTNEFVYGDRITGSYPMSASITREYLTTAGARETGVNEETGETFEAAPVYPHFWALKNRLNFYGIHSQHFKVSSSYGDKNNQNINLISIPSIFFGSKIKPGTVSLKWYFTGSLIGELQDTKQNGELIEVSGSSTGSVAGVIMYNEGFVLLTGSWALNEESIPLISGGAATSPSWLYFGAGANDGVSKSTAGQDYISASFDFSFKGVTETEVLTMFAHARRGEVNYSNNPTFLTYGQDQIQATSSNRYEENPSRTIYNTVSSSYKDYYAPFKRQVYVSKVAIYDKDKNLIGIATMANPILKEEDQDITFKLKLDI